MARPTGYSDRRRESNRKGRLSADEQQSQLGPSYTASLRFGRFMRQMKWQSERPFGHTGEDRRSMFTRVGEEAVCDRFTILMLSCNPRNQ